MKKLNIILPLSALLVVLVTTSAFHLTQAYYKNYHLGRRHFDEGRYRLAADYLLLALGEKPRSPEALLYLARTYGELNQPEKAAPLMDSLVEIHPGCLPFREEAEHCEMLEFAADVHSWAGNYERAVYLYKKILARYGADREIIFKLAEALRLAGRYEEAVKFYEDYLDG